LCELFLQTLLAWGHALALAYALFDVSFLLSKVLLVVICTEIGTFWVLRRSAQWFSTDSALGFVTVVTRVLDATVFRRFWHWFATR